MRPRSCLLVVQAALITLTISSSSCTPAANSVPQRRWEEPTIAKNIEAPKESSPKVALEIAAPVEDDSAKPAPAPEPVLPIFPSETTFAYGPWSLYRNSRGLFWWTGKGETLQLFAIALDADGSCWMSRKAGRPRVMHCVQGDFVQVIDQKGTPKTDPPSAAKDMIDGIANPPWRSKAVGVNMSDGSYDLPQEAGGKNGTFSLEATEATIKIKLPQVTHARTSDERTFVLSKDKTDLVFQGNAVDLFDGCANPDGFVPVYLGVGVKMGKQTCGIERKIVGSDAKLKLDRLLVEFTTLATPPDIERTRGLAEKTRKLVADNKAHMELTIEGDKAYTFIAARVTDIKGKEYGFVESNKIIGGHNVRCIIKLVPPDVTLFPQAIKICASMRALK